MLYQYYKPNLRKGCSGLFEGKTATEIEYLRNCIRVVDKHPEEFPLGEFAAARREYFAMEHYGPTFEDFCRHLERDPAYINEQIDIGEHLGERLYRTIYFLNPPTSLLRDLAQVQPSWLSNIHKQLEPYNVIDHRQEMLAVLKNFAVKYTR